MYSRHRIPPCVDVTMSVESVVRVHTSPCRVGVLRWDLINDWGIELLLLITRVPQCPHVPAAITSHAGFSADGSVSLHRRSRLVRPALAPRACRVSPRPCAGSCCPLGPRLHLASNGGRRVASWFLHVSHSCSLVICVTCWLKKFGRPDVRVPRSATSRPALPHSSLDAAARMRYRRPCRCPLACGH